MQGITFTSNSNQELSVLCLGAHCDDIEIGCGGTLLKLIKYYDNIRIFWLVFASNEIRKEEAHKSAGMFLQDIEDKTIRVLDFKDGFLPSFWSEVKNKFEHLKNEFSPDVIFTHYRDDLHQDHRLINELTWNTYRDHLILEYEIPKYDGDLGTPNFFVPLDENLVLQKKEIILNCFISQQNKHWLDDTMLTSILRIRGVECVSASTFAEAFYSRKMSFISG